MLVLPLSKIVEITKSISISSRLVPAINAPIIERKFFVEGGSFMITGFWLSKSLVNINNN